jgi:hypothetical protein
MDKLYYLVRRTEQSLTDFMKYFANSDLFGGDDEVDESDEDKSLDEDEIEVEDSSKEDASDADQEEMDDAGNTKSDKSDNEEDTPENLGSKIFVAGTSERRILSLTTP